MTIKDFTIIVASQCKRESLYKTIESIMKIDTSTYVGEFILVYNGTLPAPNIDFYHSSIEFNLITESSLGHSIALNTGIRKSNGKIILFTDDDAIVSENWVNGYIIGMRDENIGYSFGPINVSLNKTPPKDWNELAPKYLCGLYLGDKYINFKKIDKKNDSIGVNMAINRNILKHGLKFNEKLGPSPFTGNVGGADTLLGRQIIQNNYMCRYIPEAFVVHLVENERLSFWSLLKRKYKIGRTVLAYDFMHKEKSFTPNTYYFLKNVLKDLKEFLINAISFERIKMKKSLLKLVRSVGSLSVFVFKRDYYESIRKENYLFSSK